MMNGLLSLLVNNYMFNSLSLHSLGELSTFDELL